MANDSGDLTWYQDPSNWFIFVGGCLAVGLVWFSMGQPGVPLQDGDYGCKSVSAVQQGVPTLIPPGANVAGGEVVAVDRDSIGGAATQVAQWGDVERVAPDRFLITIVNGYGDSARYECTRY